MTAVSLRQTRTDERRRGGLLMIPAGKPVREKTESSEGRRKTENSFHQKLVNEEILEMMTKILRI